MRNCCACSPARSTSRRPKCGPRTTRRSRRAADKGQVTLSDVGVGLDADSFWLNLRPGRATGARAWLQRVELRRAISHAVDRKAFADAVFLGAAVPVFGPVTPGNARWYAPDLPKYDYDPAESRRLLASIGLADRNGDGVLEDRTGAPAEITLITQKGNTAVERGAAFIRGRARQGGAGRQRRRAGGWRGDRPHRARRLRGGLLPRLDDGPRSRAEHRGLGSAPGTRTCGTRPRRSRPPSGSARSTT